MDNKLVRNETFDIVRGLVIVMMVAANMAPLYHGEFPLPIRIIFSLAAPTFVLVSGIMISLVSKKHTAIYFLAKGLFILFLAAAVDKLIHDIVPFEGFDILYFMGISIPLAYFFMKQPKKILAITIGVFFIIGIFLRHYWGFRHGSISSPPSPGNWNLFPSEIPVKFWLIDGSFPVFPWFGIMLTGSLIHKFYLEKKGDYFFSNRCVLLLVISLFLLAVAGYLSWPSPMYPIDGYVEIFYPPATFVILALMSLSLILFAYAEYLAAFKLFIKPFILLGRGVLGLYIIHEAIIELVIRPLADPIDNLSTYFLISLMHIIFLTILVYGINKIKMIYPNRLPLLFYWCFGK